MKQLANGIFVLWLSGDLASSRPILGLIPVLPRPNQGTLKGEVSLYGWPPVWPF